MSPEEQTVFGGVSRAASNLMVCPALLEYVRAEVENDAILQKALCLARKKREAREKKGKKKE